MHRLTIGRTRHPSNANDQWESDGNHTIRPNVIKVSRTAFTNPKVRRMA
jgi:hypothetical protein